MSSATGLAEDFLRCDLEGGRVQLLLIEGDRDSSGWLAERLAALGFVARQASSVDQVLREGLASRASAIVVDVGHSGPRGSEIVRPLRDAGVERPLMLLSGRGDWRDRVETLDAGADDYLVKPIRAEEVAARLRAIIRRCSGSATDQIKAGEIQLDIKARCAWRAGLCLNLTRNEFRLLRLFMLQPKEVHSNQELRELLYPESTARSINAIEVSIARLRRKIGPERIRTIRGIGYRFIAEPNALPVPHDGNANGEGPDGPPANCN